MFLGVCVPCCPDRYSMKLVYQLIFSDFISRVEQNIFALLRTRDMAMSRYKEFGIPVNWLLDTGVVGKVCF